MAAAAAAATDLPKANGSSTTGEPVKAAQAAEAAEAAAVAEKAAAEAEAEAKSLKEELQGAREALEASEASRTKAENLLAETKEVRALCACTLGVPLVFVYIMYVPRSCDIAVEKGCCMWKTPKYAKQGRPEKMISC